MRKNMKKWNVVLLSLIMLFSLTVPAFAESASDYAILRVDYQPKVNITDEQRDALVVNLYRIANVEKNANGDYSYFATEGYESDSNITDKLATYNSQKATALETQELLLAERQKIKEKSAGGSTA